jgi:hypothetical protein
MTQDDNLPGISRRTLVTRTALIGAGLAAGPFGAGRLFRARPRRSTRGVGAGCRIANRRTGSLRTRCGVQAAARPRETLLEITL